MIVNFNRSCRVQLFHLNSPGGGWVEVAEGLGEEGQSTSLNKAEGDVSACGKI